MRIPLDIHCGTPVYRQIEAWLRENIASGSLPPETRLPSTRELAVDLGVSRITVKNAYAELEGTG
jgi:GntR family transcriptional regulator/MocR family aminotransferase